MRRGAGPRPERLGCEPAAPSSPTSSSSRCSPGRRGVRLRGVGSLISSVAGPAAAIVATALAFGLAHGLVVALPVLSLFGAILGWLRWKTDSLYPPMILHGIFNAGALIVAVTVGAS
jgi:membrane protease YdiL (CAAX protease family)